MNRSRRLAEQEAGGRRLRSEQREWLEIIRDHIAASVTVELGDFGQVPFSQKGEVGRAYRLFGEGLAPLLKQLNVALAA